MPDDIPLKKVTFYVETYEQIADAADAMANAVRVYPDAKIIGVSRSRPGGGLKVSVKQNKAGISVWAGKWA